MTRKDQLVSAQLMADYQKLYRTAYSYVRHEQDAMDIVQETAVRAIRSSDQLKDTTSLSAWLMRITVNLSLDWLRQRKRQWTRTEELDEQLPADGQQLPEEQLIRSAEKTGLMELLDQLEERERMVIVLRYFEEYKIGDIAVIMDENVNTTKSRLYRALDKLKVSYQQKLAEI